ncbi:MAG: DUF1294 domain-containing protein [Eubacteriales bacterium]|nr:DUF1294 domain-containing protein [Eubacteriales bacterium]
MKTWLVLYLIAINVITFFIFGLDKYRAIKKRSRIRVATLLRLALIGGAAGGWIAMYLFHHKTRKACFTVGIPMMVLMQGIVLFYLMNW